MLETYTVSTLLVALAEMGDRTQLLAIMLASHYRKPLPILAGILVATVDNHGLAALVEISATRLATRVDGSGDLVLLEDQDRSRWDRQAIANGRAAIERALRAGVPGPMTVQAMIAACHAAARTWESTDWESIPLSTTSSTR